VHVVHMYSCACMPCVFIYGDADVCIYSWIYVLMLYECALHVGMDSSIRALRSVCRGIAVSSYLYVRM
jgi:hypothetical protein